VSNIELELKQLQKLVMTTELKQAIDLLTMPVMELQQFIREQLENNPLLEEDENVLTLNQEGLENSDQKEEEWALFTQNDAVSSSPGYAVNRDDPYIYEARTEVFNNLYEYLIFQLNILSLNRCQQFIGKYILSNIDDQGYLTVLPNDIAANLKLPVEDVREVLEMIHEFDPPGVGCVDLQECLILQLDEKHPYYEALKEMINHDLDMVASNHIPQIARERKLPLEIVGELVEVIRSLDPRPGSSWSCDGEASYIVPDVTVKKVDDDWVVILNEWDVPKIFVNDYYRNMMKNGIQMDHEAEDYLKDKLHAAIWVLKSIEQRRKTMYDTVSAILKLQTSFFDDGAAYPMPLNLKDVADLIGVHESTVSRTVSQKYIQTPQGLFPLKYFFPKGVASGSDMNTLWVKKLLRDLIENEDTEKPLKDGELTRKMNEQGVKISRRTVAKYREQMQIPVAGQRKKF
jgi:RNA polymerase sigma-54 factor